MRAGVCVVLAACSFTPGATDTKHDAARPIDALAIDTRPIDAPKVCAASYATAFGGHHYRRTNGIMLTWPDAQTDCASDGGHLIIINDQNEDMMLATLPGLQTAYMWIGLHDVQMNDTLVWLDGSSLTFNRFLGGQPPADPGNYDCADRHSTDGAWAIYLCGYQQAGVCECE